MPKIWSGRFDFPPPTKEEFDTFLMALYEKACENSGPGRWLEVGDNVELKWVDIKSFTYLDKDLYRLSEDSPSEDNGSFMFSLRPKLLELVSHDHSAPLILNLTEPLQDVGFRMAQVWKAVTQNQSSVIIRRNRNFQYH